MRSRVSSPPLASLESAITPLSLSLSSSFFLSHLSLHAHFPPNSRHPACLSPPGHCSCRNPFYKNSRKTIEPHLLHVFEQDFYGQQLRLVVCGYLRQEANFGSLELLMSAIHKDIRLAEQELDKQPAAALAQSEALRPTL